MTAHPAGQHATCAPPRNPDQLHRRAHERLASLADANRACDCELSTRSSSDPERGGVLMRGGPHTPNSRSRRDAAALTRRVTSCSSVAELEHVVTCYRSQFNHIHVAAAIVKLARLKDTLPSAVSRKCPQSKVLVAAAVDTAASGRLPTASRYVVAETAQTCSPIGPATVAACTGEGKAGRGLSSASQRRNLKRPQLHLSETHISSSGSHNSGNNHGTVASSLCSPLPRKRKRPAVQNHPPTLSPPYPPVAVLSAAASRLLSKLLPEFLAQLHRCNSARQLANVIWALGAMGCHDQLQLPVAAARELLAGGGAKLAAALPQELSNLALGLAKLGYQELPLWAAIIAVGKERLSAFKPQELQNLAWAVAAARQDRSMVCAVVQSALPQLGAFSPSGLANLLWACAAVQYPCQELYDSAAAVLLTVPVECLNGQDVANTVWAYAKVECKQPSLVARLAEWVLIGGRGGLAAVGTQELVSMMWAFTAQQPLTSPQPQPGSPSWSLPSAVAITAAGAWQLGRTGREEEHGMHELQQQHELGDTSAVRVKGGPVASGGGAGASGISESADEDSSGATGRGMGPGTRARGGAAGTVVERSAWAPVGPSTPTPSGAAGTQDPPVAVFASVILCSSNSHESGLAVNSSCHSSINTASCQDARRAALDTPSTAGSASTLGKHSTNTNLLSQLLALLASEAAGRLDLTPQGAANALLACARSQPAALPQEPMGTLLAAAAGRAAAMQSQELCNTFWAAGKLRDAGHRLEEGVVAALVARLRRPGVLEATAPAGLAQLVDGTVRLRLVQCGLLDDLAKRLLGAAGCEALGPQEMCVVAAAVAEAVRLAKYCNPLLLNGLANAAVARVECMGPQGLSTLLCSYARANHYHGPLTTRICQLAVRRLREFGNRELSNLVWGLAVLKVPDRQLLERTARLVVARLRMRRQRVASLRWQARGVELGVEADAQEHGSKGMAIGLRRDQEQQGLDASAGKTENAVEGTLHGQQLSEELTPRSPRQQQPSMATAVLDGNWSTNHPHTRCSGATRRDATGSGGPHPGSSTSSMSAHEQLSATHLDRDAINDDGVMSTPNEEGSAASLLLRLPLPDHPDACTHVFLDMQRPPPRDAGCGQSGETGYTFRTSTDAVGHCLPSSSSSLSTGSFETYNLKSDCGSSQDSSLASSGGTVLNPPAHAKSMAKLLWAYAKCELYVPSLFRQLSAELTPLLHLLTPHEVTQVLWAVALTGHDCPELLAAGTATVTSRLAHFCAWDGSVLAWCYGKQRYIAARPLMEALQQHALRGVPFKGPALSRLAWACRELEVRLEPGFREQWQRAAAARRMEPDW